MVTYDVVLRVCTYLQEMILLHAIALWSTVLVFRPGLLQMELDTGERGSFLFRYRKFPTHYLPLELKLIKYKYKYKYMF